MLTLAWLLSMMLLSTRCWAEAEDEASMDISVHALCQTPTANNASTMTATRRKKRAVDMNTTIITMRWTRSLQLLFAVFVLLILGGNDNGRQGSLDVRPCSR